MNSSTPSSAALPGADFWKRKLAAFLHDPPSKCLDIPAHREKAEAAMKRVGPEIFDDEWIGKYDHEADWTAAAADRVPFPSSAASGLTCAFDGVRNRFHHPLCGKNQLAFPKEIESDQLGSEIEQDAQPGSQTMPAHWDEATKCRAAFFAHWRLWKHHMEQRDSRFAHLPADTRIPDHTIWNHLPVVSALAGCGAKPALLKLQLGPVQEFIIQSKSTRDLWSGSFLLSWLMAVGLKRLSELAGPDAVIFPNLYGQPLFDFRWKQELWTQIRSTPDAQPPWKDLGHHTPSLLTPNLPNVFLALVSADHASPIGQAVEEAIRNEWQAIATAVWNFCDSAHLPDKTNLTADEGGLFTRTARETRFRAQIDRFLSVAWAATPLPQTIDGAARLAKRFAPDTPLGAAWKSIEIVLDMAEQQMPVEHRDWRLYVGSRKGPKEKLNNEGIAWAVGVAFASWQLDAVRQSRNFAAWTVGGGLDPGANNNKDALNGRDEAVAGGKTWAERCKTIGKTWAQLFKTDAWVGAITLVKRTWHLAYLRDEWHFNGADDFRMPNTRGLAAHDPDDEEDVETIPASEKYFAVLALDGDEIGRWISGEKTPLFRDQLASYGDGSGSPDGALAYFERESDPDGRGTLKARFTSFLKTPRPLSPGYHLQFSEALSNFALRCADRVVRAFDGRVIYAGGDDVLALLPADTAIGCAQALRRAFQGKSPEVAGIQEAAPGFLSADAVCDQNGRPIPFIVPGPAADCSVGIAMAHFKAPLQDVVRAAQEAEKRAKKQPGRSAVAVSLFKRSGEILEWGCKWDDGGIALFDAILAAMRDGRLSAKFPHRVIELIDRYITETSPLAARSIEPVSSFDIVEVVLREFRHALDRQGQQKDSDSYRALEQLAMNSDDRPGNKTVSGYLCSVRQQVAVQSAKKLGQALASLSRAEEVLTPVSGGLRILGEEKIEQGKDRLKELRDLIAEGERLISAVPSESDRKTMLKPFEKTKSALARDLTETPLRALTGLLSAVAFAHRTAPESEANPTPKGE